MPTKYRERSIVSQEKTISFLSKEQDPFTLEDRKKIEKTFKESYPGYYPLVVCGFRMGLRIGEIIGLQWQDIDTFQKLILVQLPNESRSDIDELDTQPSTPQAHPAKKKGLRKTA